MTQIEVNTQEKSGYKPGCVPRRRVDWQQAGGVCTVLAVCQQFPRLAPVVALGLLVVYWPELCAWRRKARRQNRRAGGWRRRGARRAA